MVKQGLAEVIDSIKEESHDSVILVEGKRDKEALRKAGISDYAILQVSYKDENKIVVDANQGYTLREAQLFLSKIEAFNIGFLEQPVKFSDFYALKRLKESSSIPIMADESMKSIEDFRKLNSMDAVSMIKIKIMKVGGIAKAIQIAKESRSRPTFTFMTLKPCLL